MRTLTFLFATFYLSALTTLTACNNYKQPENGKLNTDNIESDTLKPVVTTSFTVKAYPAIFETAFFTNTKVSEGDIAYRFYGYDIGKINIESGKIIACDPIVMYNATPFTQLFPKGLFPVHLALAKTDNDERVAFSRIVFLDKPVSKWEVALEIGQKPISLNDTNFYCYGVDAGTGIFIDSVANVYFNQKKQAEWENVFVEKSNINKGFIHDFEGHNLATFSTGYGDGCYATYIGFDNEGNICQILTDFGLVEWWKPAEKKR